MQKLSNFPAKINNFSNKNCKIFLQELSSFPAKKPKSKKIDYNRLQEFLIDNR